MYTTFEVRCTSFEPAYNATAKNWKAAFFKIEIANQQFASVNNAKQLHYTASEKVASVYDAN